MLDLDREYELDESVLSGSGIEWVNSAFDGKLVDGVIKNRGYLDPLNFLISKKPLVISTLIDVISKFKNVKADFILVTDFVRGNKKDTFYNRTNNKLLVTGSNIDDYFDEVIESLISDLEESQYRN